MDPNETLKQLREHSQFPRTERADEILDLFEALDKWLSNKGFLPDAWDACLCQERQDSYEH